VSGVLHIKAFKSVESMRGHTISQRGPSEARPCEVCPGKVRHGEVCLGEGRPAEVCLSEICPGEICPGEVCPTGFFGENAKFWAVALS
jgi:hypothetical protein